MSDAVPALPRRPDRHRAGVQPAVGADGQQLQAVPAGFVGADRHRLGRRQPHARLPQGRPRQGHAGRVPHPRQRRQQLLRVRRHDRRRAVRHPQRAAARRAVRRQRLRGDRHRPHPVEPARRDRAVGGLVDRQGVLRRRRAPPHPHDGQGRVAGLQPDRHRLGAAPLLGTHLSWSDQLIRYQHDHALCERGRRVISFASCARRRASRSVSSPTGWVARDR